MTAEANIAANPLIGDLAPDFEARTTAGTLRLSDFRGRWLVLFSHPGDFTPVCTSEFIALARAEARFAALGCALMAVSVDSLYAHFGWIRAIREAFGVTITFPIIEDSSLVIGRAYGMIRERAPDAAAMRSTFFIDPNGIIRAITTYPATIGRSVDEMLRVAAALQRVDSGNIGTPEGWRPGDDVLLPPDLDLAALMAERGDSPWFCRSAPDPGAGRGD